MEVCRDTTNAAIDDSLKRESLLRRVSDGLLPFLLGRLKLWPVWLQAAVYLGAFDN